MFSPRTVPVCSEAAPATFREYSELLMMFHVKSCDVEVIAAADLQSEDSGRPDEAVSCLPKAAVHGRRRRHRCRLVGHFTPVWASWSAL